MIESSKVYTSLVAATMTISDDYINKGSEADIFNNALTLVYFATGIVAVIVLIIAGFLYVTSNGDPGKVKTAKNAILYTVIGIIFVLAAAIIVAFVRSSV